MGTGTAAQIQHPTKTTAFRVGRANDHTTHPGLYQGSGAHRAGFEGDQQGAVVEPPVAAQARCLPQGHQLGMPQGVTIQLAPVAAPANRTAFPIEQHRRHRDLAGPSHRFGASQQPVHPGLGLLIIPITAGSSSRCRAQGRGAAAGATDDPLSRLARSGGGAVLVR